ncbi:MAG: alpha/beta hydrolase [Pseudonocardia sp.]|nr:alpha/beta hydrolase [Pseudonocardia sp.]
MNRQQTIWGAVGAAAAAAAGLAVGVAAHKRNQIATERRRLATQLTDGTAESGVLPPGRQVSVIADDGLRLACEEIAPLDGGPPDLTVVLVHGFALDRRTWHFQRRTFAELPGSTGGPRVHQVLYDVRSHGRSDRGTRQSCTIEQLGRDLEAVIRTLVPDGPIVLVGHSMGGMTVMALAEQYPELFGERIVGVALVSTSAGEVGSAGLPGALLSRRNPLTRGVGMLAAAQPALVEAGRKLLGDFIWAITRSFAYGDRTVAPWMVDLVDTMISANAVDALTDFVDTVNTHDRIVALPALAGCEVLVAAGDADRVIPFSHAERIAGELVDATLVRFPGVGHMPMLERHDALDDALVELLRRGMARTAGAPAADRGHGALRRLRWRA